MNIAMLNLPEEIYEAGALAAFNAFNDRNGFPLVRSWEEANRAFVKMWEVESRAAIDAVAPLIYELALKEVRGVALPATDYLPDFDMAMESVRDHIDERIKSFRR